MEIAGTKAVLENSLIIPDTMISATSKRWDSVTLSSNPLFLDKTSNGVTWSASLPSEGRQIQLIYLLWSGKFDYIFIYGCLLVVSLDLVLQEEHSGKLAVSWWLKKSCLLHHTLQASLSALGGWGLGEPEGKKTGLFEVLAKTIRVEYQNPYAQNQLTITAHHH